jgi:carbon storage regulator CsrA
VLILKRRRGQSIQVGADIVITVIGIQNGSVLLGVSAPLDQLIRRYQIRVEEPPDGPERPESDQNLH